MDPGPAATRALETTPSAGASEPLRPPGPLLFAALVRGVVAGLGAHALVGLLLLAALLVCGADPPDPYVWVYLLGVGAAGGAAWGGAERAAVWRLPAGLLLGLSLVPAALLCGEWLVLLLQAGGHTSQALQDLARTPLPEASELGLALGGAALLLGPLFLARARGVGLTGELAAALLGALAAVLLGALLPLTWDRLSFLSYLGLACALPLGWALSLRLGGLAERALSRALRLSALEDTRAAPARDEAAADSLASQAEAAELAGRWAEAAERWAEAYQARPQGRGATRAARAWARAGDQASAREWLVQAGRWPGRAARSALDDPALEPLRREPALQAAFSGRPEAARHEPALAALLLLALAVLGLAALGLACQGETADVTRRRAMVRLVRDPDRLYALGRELLASRPPEPVTVWLPRAAGAFPGLEETAPEAARAAFLAAARAGHTEAMAACAELTEGEGQGALRPEARRWWRQAAEAGHPGAMRRWAEVLASGWGGEPRDPAGAEAWSRRADLAAVAAEEDPGE